MIPDLDIRQPPPAPAFVARGLLAALLLLLPPSAVAQNRPPDPELTVTEGDTIWLDDERFRLWGIDAPEMDQTCAINGEKWRIGEMAAEELAYVIGFSSPICRAIETDPHGRTVAICTINGRDLGASMVARGWAWDFERYSGGAYADEQRQAQAAGFGLWAGNCIAPWDWRRNR